MITPRRRVVVGAYERGIGDKVKAGLSGRVARLEEGSDRAQDVRGNLDISHRGAPRCERGPIYPTACPMVDRAASPPNRPGASTQRGRISMEEMRLSASKIENRVCRSGAQIALGAADRPDRGGMSARERHERLVPLEKLFSCGAGEPGILIESPWSSRGAPWRPERTQGRARDRDSSKKCSGSLHGILVGAYWSLPGALP